MSFYRLAASAVALVHAAYVAFVVFGLAAIVFGLATRKAWARGFWFRTVHLAMIGVVTLQSWLGVVCPLTTLEKSLRRMAGDGEGYSTGFIQHWVHRLIFFDLPPSVFVAGYTLFGLVVAGTFVFFPPTRAGSARGRIEAPGTN